jgi:hypothetical protein
MKVYRGFEKESYLDDFCAGKIRFTHPLYYVKNNKPHIGDPNEGTLQHINTYGDCECILIPMILSTARVAEGVLGKYVVSFNPNQLANEINKHLKQYNRPPVPFISHGPVKYVDKNNPPEVDIVGGHSIFIKDDEYKNQSEYRFVILNPNTITEFKDICNEEQLKIQYSRVVELTKRMITGELTPSDRYKLLEDLDPIETAMTIQINWIEPPTIQQPKGSEP